MRTRRARWLLLALLLGFGLGSPPPAAAQEGEETEESGVPDEAEGETDAEGEGEAAEVPLVTLEEALDLARVHAPALRTADENVDRAEAQALEPLLARLPSLSARVTISPAGPVRGNAIESTTGTDLGQIEDIFDELTYQLNSELRATLPLYTFGKILLAEDLADVGVEVAELRRLKEELELVFDVTRAYLGLQLAEAMDELIADGTRRLNDARRKLEERLLAGEADARTQLRELTIEEAGFVGQVADNRALTALARRGLAYYCGIAGDFRVTPLDDELDELVVAELDALLELAWEHRPDLRLLDRAVAAADLNAAFEWRQLVPNLFFAFGLRYNRNPLADDQPSPFANDPYNSRGFGFLIGLDWEFDPRQIAQARMADEEADRARAQQEEAVGGIEVEITQAWYDALGQRDRAVAYDEALRAARAWLRQRTLQFDSGLADYDDLSEPLLAYFATFAGYHQALFEMRLARANLALKVGLERLELGTGLVEPADEAE